MKAYENRVVLFLDILGFKEIIKEEKAETIYQALDLIKREALKINEKGSTMVTQVSDSVAISFKLEDAKDIIPFFEVILPMIMKLVERGILCRGAIALGSLLHDRDFIFGPAFNVAYKTEQHAAIYPRVILDNSVVDAINKSQLNSPLTKRYKDHPPQLTVKHRLYVQGSLNEDTDGKSYFDYFTGSLYLEGEQRLKYLLSLRQATEKIKKQNDPSLEIKYGWMKNKFNNLMVEFRKDSLLSVDEMTQIQNQIKEIE